MSSEVSTKQTLSTAGADGTSQKPLHFCLVFFSLGTGGTETLIVRMSRWLVRHGHRVTVFSRNDGPMRHQLEKSVQVVVDPKLYASLFTGGTSTARRVLTRFFQSSQFDVFYSFTPETVWIAAALLNAQRKPARFLVGVYRPGLFEFGSKGGSSLRARSFAYPSQYLFQQRLPASCRLYMNEAVRRDLETTNGVPVPGQIWPLPVDASPFTAIQRKPAKGLILSVGNMVTMKEYNLWMIDLVEELLKRGYDVRWDVYGEGPYRAEMESRISSKSLEGRIRLLGTCPYDELAKAFARAWVFVGMGTSLVEAAFAGVPAIAAIAFDLNARTYGFFHELSDYSVGERIDQPTKPVLDLIEQVLNCDGEEYERLARAERKHAGRFELEPLMLRFMELVEQAPEFERIWRPASRQYFRKAYDWVMKPIRAMRSPVNVTEREMGAARKRSST